MCPGRLEMWLGRFLGSNGMVHSSFWAYAPSSTSFPSACSRDTRDMGQYVRGGYLSGTKKQETMRFKSLGDSIQSPEFVVSDYAQMDRPGQLHVAWLALHRYWAGRGRILVVKTRALATPFPAEAGRVVQPLWRLAAKCGCIETLPQQSQKDSTTSRTVRHGQLVQECAAVT